MEQNQITQNQKKFKFSVFNNFPSINPRRETQKLFKTVFIGI